MWEKVFLSFYETIWRLKAVHYFPKCPIMAGSSILLFPANNYLLEVTNRNNRKRCETCSKITIETLVFPLLTLNKQL